MLVWNAQTGEPLDVPESFNTVFFSPTAGIC
jgi:hypothetical protein